MVVLRRVLRETGGKSDENQQSVFDNRLYIVLNFSVTVLIIHQR